MTTTLVEAIEHKFEMLTGVNDELQELQHVSLYGSPISASGSLSLPPVLVMDNSGVSDLGDVDRLGRMCRHVTELDLCNNRLADWPSLLQLLGRLPRLRWLNLSLNPLLTPPPTLAEPPLLPQLETLVLNKVPLTWPLLAGLLSAAPAVSELHLCNNSLAAPEPCHPAGGYPAVRQLYFNGNRLQPADWAGLAAWFPCLEKLTLIDNAIGALPDDGPVALLAGLKSLNLSENCIAEWAQLEKLNCYSGLADLRILDIELGKDRPKEEFRSESVARLIHVSQLNGTSVSEDERVNAERAFIRRYANTAGGGSRLDALVAKHGQLDELAHVDLKPVESVNLVLRYDDQSRACDVATDQTVGDLKRFVCAQFGLQELPSSKLALYYVDQGMIGAFGPDLMNLPGRAFHSYRPEDGDELILRPRGSSDHAYTRHV